MPTIIHNNNGEALAITYEYKEVDSILKPTESYNKKIKEYQEYADMEGCSIEEAYDSLGCSNTWKEENKSLLISCMIQEKKLKMIHNIKNNKFLYILL